MGGMRVAAVAVTVLAIVAGTAWGADVTVWTKENAQAAPSVESLPLKSSVSQYGITWTFEKPVPVGQFINGDYYVVGPVKVTAIDPRPLYGSEVTDEMVGPREMEKVKPADRMRNGSMLNPPAKKEMACDSGIRSYYRKDLASKLPIEMKAKDSLVSTISLGRDEKASFVYHSSGGREYHDNCPIRVAAILTCVEKPQPPDAFRPGYCDREQTIYLARNLRRELLPRLEPIKGAPDAVKFAEVFQKAWLNPGFFGFDQPMENMPHYGQWVGQAVSDAGLVLCSDIPAEKKEKLLENFVQVGIDYWGAVKSGHPGWEGWGGHGSGRKLPVVLAGVLLGDERMASPTKSFPKVNFGEDNQTMYGRSWTGAEVVFAGHSGMHADGTIPRKHWGPYEHMDPSQWDKNGQKNRQSEAYRRANTSCCWVGQALVLRVMKLEPQWNHDAFFDYVDRWMTEDDKAAREEINKYFPDKNLVNPEKEWCHQGYTGEDWVKTAWEKYRKLSPAPTDGWKTKKENPPPAK